MAIPDFQTIMLPLLKLTSDGEPHDFLSTTERLAKEFKLTDEEISTLIPSGQQRFANRVGWAKTYLKKAGLLEYPQRGLFQITQRGNDVLRDNIEKIDMSYLQRFPEFLAFRGKSQSEVGEGEQIVGNGELTPDEEIENAYQRIRAELADDLLEYVLKCSPAFFERLVVDLLVSMGYGGTQADAARSVGRSGDEGIDGIINEDRLGLDTVYIQAKRWQRDSKIGSSVIREFAGALQGYRANKGVFLTTADFTKDALNFVKNISSKIVLINGQQLANLMIDFGIGVTTRTNYEIKKLDTDYFGEIQ